jgi:hypothetical protein
MTTARVEALRAALSVRTPGTTPDQTLALAQQFLDWLDPLPLAKAPEAGRNPGQPPKR